MKPHKHSFDPFENRLARNLRNELSAAFIHSLDEMDAGLFRAATASYLQREIEPGFREYIEDRLDRYREVFDEIQAAEVKDPFAQTMLLWHKGLLFEAHERFESFWKDVPADTRQAIKGLIKAVAACIHKEYGHERAAASLADKAAGLLRDYGSFLPAFINTDRIVARLVSEDLSPPFS